MVPPLASLEPRLPLTALILFQFTVIAGKTAVSLMTWERFGRQLRPLDLVATFGTDSALTLAALLALVTLYRVGGRLTELPLFRRSLAARLSVATRLLFDIATTAFITFTIGLYMMSVYVFWEWGAFLEPQHYVAMEQARVTAGVVYVLTRPLAMVPIATLVLALVAGWFLHFRSRTWPRVAAVTLLVTSVMSLGAVVPSVSERARELSTLSPIVGFFAKPNLEKSDSGLPPEFLERDLTGFEPLPPRREPLEKYRALDGAARGMDVVIVIFESMRTGNLPVYGYARETTPTISRLARNGLVFDAAYVTQPRSSKSLVSMTMGTWPDPRLESEIWDARRFVEKENLVSRLQRAGYQSYFGMTADRRNDGFGEYMRQISGPDSPVVGGQDLGYDGSAMEFTRDDKRLVQHYLSWAGDKKGPLAAILWFDTAHFPYHPVYQRFRPESSTVVRYDNCLYSSDMALHRLLSGLERLGRRQNTLVVLMGDHGEGLGEHLDVAHGSFLYEHSVRFPLIMHNERIWRERVDVPERTEIKDLPATLFYMLGLPTGLRQSEVAFSRSTTDRIYLSNVYQDFKIGMLEGAGIKFVYQPRFGAHYVFDLSTDPNENENRSGEFSQSIPGWEDDVLRWYAYQVGYIGREFPVPAN